MTPLMDVIASDAVIDAAYAWLCLRRQDVSSHNDVWRLRWRWADIKPQIQRHLLACSYDLSPVEAVHVKGDTYHIWSAADALVLKATALVLTRHLGPQVGPRVFHLPGRGGAKAAVRTVVAHLPANRFVLRTDVEGYYASIDHEVLDRQVEPLVHDHRLRRLLWQYLRHTIDDNGHYREVRHGIALGCPLSPVMGALYLHPLDEAVRTTGLCYARFMDDWVILSPTRWKLRRAIATVNRVLEALKLRKHPEKTTIGYIDRGFDFLGYHFSRAGLTAARHTVRNFLDKLARLYEQQASAARLGQYGHNWLRWFRSGVTPHLVRRVGWRGERGVERDADTGRCRSRRIHTTLPVSFSKPMQMCSGAPPRLVDVLGCET